MQRKLCSSIWKMQFFFRDARGSLRQLPINTLYEKILTADGATLKQDNQKNGWKGVCVYQDHKEDEKFSPARALGKRCISIHQSMINRKTFFSAYWIGGKRKDVTADNMSATLKFAATALYYPSLKGIPVKRVDRNLLRSGEANALLLVGYSNRYPQKMGQWRG